MSNSQPTGNAYVIQLNSDPGRDLFYFPLVVIRTHSGFKDEDIPNSLLSVSQVEECGGPVPLSQYLSNLLACPQVADAYTAEWIWRE